MKTQKYVKAICIIGMLLCFSCKVYKKVDWIEPRVPKEERSKYFEPRQLSKLSKGDILYIKTKESISFDIRYSEVRNDSIYGLFLQKNERKLKVPINTGIPISVINELKVSRLDLGISIGAGILIPVIFWFIIDSSLSLGLGFGGSGYL